MLNIGHREDRTIEWAYFFLRCTGFSVPSDPRQALLRTLRGWAFLVAMLAIPITCGDFWYNSIYGNFNDMCYSLINVLTNAFILAKFLVIVTKPQFPVFLQLTRDTLWGNAKNDYEKQVLRQCEKDTGLYLTIFAILAQSSSLAYIVEPVIYNIMLKNMTDVRERHYPLRVVFDLPVFETPNFQIFFFIQVSSFEKQFPTFGIIFYVSDQTITVNLQFLFVYYASILWLAYDNYLALVNIYAAGQLNILSRRLATLYEKNRKQLDIKNIPDQNEGYLSSEVTAEFKDCVRRHQFLINLIDELDGIFTVMNLVQVVILSLIICLVGYQLIMPGNPVIRRVRFIIYMGGCMVQLFSFAKNCGNVTDASINIAEGAYAADWNSKNFSESGRVLTRNLMFMMLRTKYPSSLTAAGFFRVTLSTFNSTLSTAFSYLTLIRQTAAKAN